MTVPTPPARAAWRELDAVVQVLAPADAAPLSEFLEGARDAVGAPFTPARRAAVGALSAAFLEDPAIRSDPASVAAAYWMRPAMIARLAEAFEQRRAAEPHVVRVPAGRVFHVAPSNVDTLFLYSWALSFLCGNANVVRVSRDRPVVVEAMLRAVDRVGRDHPELRNGDRFVTYEHEARVTTALSQWCSQRILWGGDATVAELRPLPLNPHAGERVFGSKFSYAVVSAAAYGAADDAERARLAGAFFNDLFWFDQMACSSPHVVFWVGAAAAVDLGIVEFERRLQQEVDRRGYATAVPDAVRRLSFAFELAADADVRVDLAHPGFVGVRVHDAPGLTKVTCGGGLVRHARLERLEELAAYATEVDQTITHYGFDAEALRSLATRSGTRGVDRLVPIGQALAFDVVWDGYDLIDDLTRKVTVREA